jgi:hypothetical protein
MADSLFSVGKLAWGYFFVTRFSVVLIVGEIWTPSS